MEKRLRVAAGQYTHPGRRPYNEDCCGIRLPDDEALERRGVAALVADGVFAAGAGREASEACVRGFLADYYATPESWSTKTAAGRVLAALNRWLHRRGDDPAAAQWLTTLSLLILKGRHAWLFHIGDTRIARLRDGRLQPLTRDHTRRMGKRRVLTRAMGAEPALEIDCSVEPLCEGDLFLLSSDGVHGVLDDDTLAALLRAEDDPERAARAIVEAALARGGEDNASCQVLRVLALPERDVDPRAGPAALPVPPPLRPGQRLDGLTVLRELHASPRSQVYLVHHPTWPEPRVMKCPSPNAADDPVALRQFLDEEWAGRRIDNPHVLRIVDPPQPRSALYHLSEYHTGRSLRQWLDDRGRATLDEARDLLGQLARGLNAFHKLEMVHGDLKPENLLVDAHGTLRIIDFGSVYVPALAEAGRPAGAAGTYNYSAPERIAGAAGDPRSDLYSFGVIAYELLTGALPYGEIDRLETLRRRDYRSARGRVPELPPWVDAALRKAVDKNPDRRYETPEALLLDLGRPNPALLEAGHTPLLERDPLRFWQLAALAGWLLAALLALLALGR
ncbi:MAG: protein kinase [Gammaproteobacteria bacterium]|nr:MAG: protein kinase [Gammaproteobacteria bacterium]